VENRLPRWVAVLFRKGALESAPLLHVGQASAKVHFVGFTAKSFPKHCYSFRQKKAHWAFFSLQAAMTEKKGEVSGDWGERGRREKGRVAALVTMERWCATHRFEDCRIGSRAPHNDA